MKKTYNKPTLIVVKVKVDNLLTTSDVNNTCSNADQLGRGSRYSEWEDDDAAVEE